MTSSCPHHHHPTVNHPVFIINAFDVLPSLKITTSNSLPVSVVKQLLLRQYYSGILAVHTQNSVKQTTELERRHLNNTSIVNQSQMKRLYKKRFIRTKLL